MGKIQKQRRNAHENNRSTSGASVQNAFATTTVWHWRDFWAPEWVGLLVIGLGLIIVPYFRGLYFDSDMMVVEQVLCLLLLATGMWKWAQHVRSTRVIEKGRPMNVQQADIFYDPRHLFVFALLIPYVIGLWTAVAPYDNWLQLFRYAAYAVAFFIVAEALSRRPGAGEFLQACMQISIGWTALFAIAAAMGQVSFEDAVLHHRLSSVFQYPNTFGIILAVGTVGGLLLTLRRQWWLQALGGLFLVPMGYVFLLTYSRGAWLFFPLIYLLGLLLLPMRMQWAYLIHSVPLAAGVGILLLVFGTQLSDAPIGTVWGWILTAMVVCAAGYPILARYLTRRFMFIPGEKSAGNFAKQLAVPAVMAAMLAGAIYAVLYIPSVQELLPDAIQSRVAQIDLEQDSVLSRQMFNQDALEIFLDYPVFGAGGGGWRALFQKYQDYPYWSTQSHNFFSQLMVETGTLGMLLFAGIFLYYIYRGFYRYICMDNVEQRVAGSFFLVILLGLLGHSAIDFNMSYGYVGFLILLSLAGWQAANPMQQRERIGESSSRRFRAFYQSLPIPVRRIQSVTFLFLLVLSVTMFFPIHNDARAEVMYREAGEMLKDGDVATAIDHLEQIIQKSPYNPSYHLTYGSLLISIGQQQDDEQILQQGIEHIQRVVELASTHPQQLAQAAQNMMDAGKIEEAFDLIQQSLTLGAWDIHLYPIFMEIAYEAGEQRLAEGKEDAASQAWQAGLHAFEQIAPMRAALDELPKTLNKGRAFGETEELKLWAGKLHYRLGQFQLAYERLHPLHESEDAEIQRQAVLWSMAAQLQSGVPLEQTAGYDLFVQHPEWSDGLRPILALKVLSDA